jgi:predicted peptidase
MSGELKPNSHQNIKMTLVCSRYPTHFEGEIQCQIEWENEGDDKKHHDAKSMQTTTVVNDIGEFLFIRLKKRSKIVSLPYIQTMLLDQDPSSSREQRSRSLG